jgi:biopolymer transport protein ExbD
MSDGLVHFRCPVCRQRICTVASNAERPFDCPGCESPLLVPVTRPGAAVGDELVAEETPMEFEATDRSGDVEMDMTPMVDVTFLLLIFFMVTAAFTMQKSFKLPTPDSKLPSTQVREENEDAVVTVRVDEFNTFHVSSSQSGDELEAPNEQELLRRMREAKAGDGQGVINALIVEADGDALHSEVVKVMDAGNEVGFEDIKLRTLDDEREE